MPRAASQAGSTPGSAVTSRIRHNAFLAAGIRSPFMGADPSLPPRRAQLRPVLPMRSVLNAVRIALLILVASLLNGPLSQAIRSAA
ncbi:hypothetical protein DFH09DRAFT_1320001 [Mycena vulgaris]|nr:hypothetical protein DFH09DRAFT_1320001 [Mycena vulgaris]